MFFAQNHSHVGALTNAPSALKNWQAQAHHFMCLDATKVADNAAPRMTMNLQYQLKAGSYYLYDMRDTAQRSHRRAPLQAQDRFAGHCL